MDQPTMQYHKINFLYRFR